MAVSAFQKLVNKLFKQFVLRHGREPQTPKEWMDIQNEAVQFFNKTKGVPPSAQEYTRFQGWTPKVIPGGKGIESLLKSGDVKVGVAPKTKLSTLEGKKQKLDTAINKEQWIAKKKQENKDAVRRFKEKEYERRVKAEKDKAAADEDYIPDIIDPEEFASGGRANFIFGGSAGLRALIKRMRGEHKRLMPSKIGIDKRDLAKKLMPREFEQLENLKIEQLENLLEALKMDKRQMAMRASHRAMNDPGVNFFVQKLEEIPGSGLTPEADLAKYVDIDKDILSLEQMIKNKRMKGRKPHESGGLAYMLGEPTYMKAGGGQVGHGPWTTGQIPQGPQDRPEMPQPQVGGGGGQPDPMKAPRLPNVAPRSMDPQVMQQQMMQRAMGQQGIPQGIPRVGMMYGGDPGFAFEYGGSWADWHDQHRNAMPIEDYIQTKLPKERLPFRQNFAGGGMTRRAFMKLMSGLAALPFIGKGVQKAAPKVIPKAAEVIARDADGIPTYAFDLIEVVKAKGTKEIMEGIYKRNPPSTKYNYKGVEVVEDGLGNTSVRKEQTQTGSWTDEATDDTIVDDYVDREIGFEIRKGEDIVKDEGLETQKAIRGADEYNESTAYMQGDPEGGMDVAEIAEQIDIEDHLDLKKIADEIIDIRPKKASGGLAHMLGE
jgi:hypothetical protein